jgi:NADPH:quinone reductase-like Zn-dependent oxidoreductase
VYAQLRTDRIGTFAERIAVPEADVALKPATVTLEEAGSLPLVALTAWQALVEKGNLRPGQRVLIHAGAGGVGTIAMKVNSVGVAVFYEFTGGTCNQVSNRSRRA